MSYLKNVLNTYPVRDKRLVEKTIYPIHGIPLGMRQIKHDIAYLRHAIGLGNIFFYQALIPNGIVIQKKNN